MYPNLLTKLLLAIMLAALPMALTSCDDDDNYAEAGTIHYYAHSEAYDVEDGTYIIHNPRQYNDLMRSSMPHGLNVDFNRCVLVIVKGHETQGIKEIEATCRTDADKYLIDITVSLNITLPIEHWCIAAVMPKVPGAIVETDIRKVNPW